MSIDLEKTPSEYINSGIRNFEELEEFVQFMALHPELSLANNVLLYAQAGKEAPRFYCHRGIARYQKYSMEKFYWMLGVSNEGKTHFEKEVVYPVPDEKLNAPVNIRKVFDRIGYAILKTGTEDVEVDHKSRKIVLPGKMDEAERNAELVRILADYFFHAYAQRGLLVSISTDDYSAHYGPALCFMAGCLLGLEGLYLSKQFYTDFFDRHTLMKRPYERIGISEREYKLAVLSMLYMELDQVMEGRHFTIFETEFFRLSKGNPYCMGEKGEPGEAINMDEDNPRPFDIFLSYGSFLLRYMDDEIDRVRFEKVHQYPCFRFDDLKKIEKK